MCKKEYDFEDIIQLKAVVKSEAISALKNLLRVQLLHTMG